MTTLNGVFDIAKTALLAHQKSLNVTSHNIANANTAGYTRQRVVLETMTPVNFGGQFFGTGVDVKSVERVYDSFQTIQLRDASSGLSRFETRGQHLSGLESILNDFDGAGLSSRLDAFFNTAADVAANPSSYGERAALLSNARVLADTFNHAASNFEQNLSGVNSEIVHKVDKINGLASRIADFNGQISAVELSGTSANDLRDQRDLLLEELAGFVDINVTENDIGQVDVYVGGSFLVAANKTASLTVLPDSRDTDTPRLMLNGGTINDRITGGSLKGDLEGIEYYKDARDRINLLSASLVKEVNLQHEQGWGLDGSTGEDFFTPLSVYSNADSANAGGATISGGAVTDLNALTLDDYEIRFSGPGAYSVVNTANDSVVTSGAYNSGGAITFDGLSVVITDSPKTPQAGDRFIVSSTRRAASEMGVALTDPKKVAASGTSTGLPGDNTNALAIADLREASAAGNTTFSQYYNSIVTDLGTAARDAKINYEAQSKFTQELRAAKEAVSGVSIEEEAINLVKLQRAYEAAAKVMSTVDQMMDTILRLR
ncbi:Flagellar hook-associated protein 1 [uncultured bacterium]|nr:Flagellar hook-associated protein 1 [uncultured bacterium]